MRGVTQGELQAAVSMVFQPALPMRGVTELGDLKHLGFEFQPALPMRGVTTECYAYIR